VAANRRQVPELKLIFTNDFLTPSMEGKLDIKQTRELLEIKTGPAEVGASRRGCGLGRAPTSRRDLMSQLQAT